MSIFAFSYRGKTAFYDCLETAKYAKSERYITLFNN